MTRVAALVVLILLASGAYLCIDVLDERQTGFRTRLGAAEDVLGAVLDEPGPYIAVPGLHAVQLFDKRLQRYDARPRELQIAENLRIEADYYLVWRVENPQAVYTSLGSNEQILRVLDDTAFQVVRDELAKRPIGDLLSSERSAITQDITRLCDEQLRPRGIEIVDLQIRDARYPSANLTRIFERMRSEKDRASKRFRAEGEEEARKIRSQADRDAQVLKAQAQSKSIELRGEGDAIAAATYAEAYDQDREFYAFLRTLEAYKTALDDQTTLILSPEVPFLRYLFKDGAGGAGVGAGSTPGSR